MKLQLLCLTMPTRTEFFARLYKALDAQLDHKNTGLLARMCDRQLTLGENREILRQASRGEYIAFVDDDDTVAEDYISSILPLLDGVDYIGFNVQCSIDGVPLKNVTRHTLSAEGWYEDESGHWRDISHLNPMRRDLALLEPFEGGHGEDVRWADRMRKRGVVKTEHYIPKVLYNYFFRSRKNQGRPCPQCKSESTVLVELGTHCNSCATLFDEHPPQKSCLWA